MKQESNKACVPTLFTSTQIGPRAATILWRLRAHCLIEALIICEGRRQNGDFGQVTLQKDQGFKRHDELAFAQE
jgi:hypothetical protein